MFSTRMLGFVVCLWAVGLSHDATAQIRDPFALAEPAANAQPAPSPIASEPRTPVPQETGLGPSPQTDPMSAKVQAAPTWRLLLNNLFVLRFNPVGLEDQLRLGIQRRLPAIEGSEGLLFRDRFVFAGIAPRLNPAFVKIGPSLELQPLSILNLRVTAEYMYLFSTFGFLQSFASARDDYSDPLMAACASADPTTRESCRYTDGQGVVQQGSAERRNYRTGGLHMMVEPTVQLKLGPVLLRNRLSLEYWYMDLRDGDRVFFDVTLDTLVPARGWVLANDLDLAWMFKFGLMAGVRYSVVQPFYSGNDLRPGEFVDFVHNGVQRIGPILSYTFFDRGFVRFNKPTILLISGFYVSHRYRAGQEPAAVFPGLIVQNPAMPYLVIGFSFQSDLLSPAAKR